MQEMPMVTGIGMGVIRTALEIEKDEGLLRKCWWGPWNCADALEGKTIEPENLFETNDSETSFPVAVIGSCVGALLVLILSFLLLLKIRKEKTNHNNA